MGIKKSASVSTPYWLAVTLALGGMTACTTAPGSWSDLWTPPAAYRAPVSGSPPAATNRFVPSPEAAAPAASAALSAAPSATASLESTPSDNRIIVQALLDAQTRKLGLVPGSAKARSYDRWMLTIVTDPAFKAKLPAGTTPTAVAMRKVVIAVLFLQGLTRLSPQERLEWYALNAKVFARVVPDNCYGSANLPAVAAKAMVPGNLTDAEMEQFGRLMYHAIHAAAINASPQALSADELQQATRERGMAMLMSVKGNKTDLDRMASIAVDPLHVSPEDSCWLHKVETRTTLGLSTEARDRSILATYQVATAVANGNRPPVGAYAPMPARPAGPNQGGRPATHSAPGVVQL